MIDNRDKFISSNTVLVGTRTFKECYRENENVFSPEFVEFAYNVLNMVEEFVNKTPPEDAVKVVHGHWINDEEYHICSVCNNPVVMNRLSYDKWCRNCGAKMDGDPNG